MRRSALAVVHAGLTPYLEGVALQKDLEARRIAGAIGDTLILTEHPPVITLGHRGNRSNVLASEQHLRSMGIEVHRASRGGDATYHGPGQLVVYPIVNVDERRMTVAAFVELLEEAMIRTALESGVTARRVERIRGVFVDNDKLGAVGIRLSRGVTTHGLALNVDPDLSHYELIVPCGLRDHGVTSLCREADRPVTRRAVEQTMVRHLASLLGTEAEEATLPSSEGTS